MFKREWIGVITSLREQRSEKPVAGALSGVQGLDHRSEVGLDTCSHRCCNRQRHSRLRQVESEQVGHCGGGAEGPDRRRGMPAFVVMMKAERAR